MEHYNVTIEIFNTLLHFNTLIIHQKSPSFYFLFLIYLFSKFHSRTNYDQLQLNTF